MESHKAVLSIYHENTNGDIRRDGSGFLLSNNGNLYFITCAHNFNFENDEKHFFEIGNEKHIIERGKHNINVGNISNIKTFPKEGSDDLICYEPDFLVYRLEIASPEQMDVLTSRNSLTVEKGEQLQLVSHSIETGLQERFDCFRNDLKETATLSDSRIKRYIERTNILRLKLKEKGPQKGNSGGPVIDTSGQCIGFLTRGGHGYIYIFKIEDLPLE